MQKMNWPMINHQVRDLKRRITTAQISRKKLYGIVNAAGTVLDYVNNKRLGAKTRYRKANPADAPSEDVKTLLAVLKRHAANTNDQAELVKIFETCSDIMTSAMKRIKKDHEPALTNVKTIYALYGPKLQDEKKEHFYALPLDSKLRVLWRTKRKDLKEHLVSIGALNFSVVHPREVFKPAIQLSATSIILLHNHPSGDPSPSQEDIFITEKLIKAGKIIGIEVLDHIIIGNCCYVSFIERLGEIFFQ